MSSKLPSHFKELKNDDNIVKETYPQNYEPEIKQSVYKNGEIPSKVIEKLEATELTNDIDNETSLKYNLSHLFTGNKTPFSIFLLFVDLILVGVYFTIIGYILAWFLNNYTVTKLDIDKSGSTYKIEDSKSKIFSILILECIALIIAIYLAIQVGLRLPYVLKKSPLFHRDYRVYSGGIILIYTLMSLQDKMREKARYVFNSNASKQDIDIKTLIDCVKEVDGTSPTWVNFRDCIDKIN
tara:strand:+ start:643 stop:1359 length:717 start_codon:yes stop_codon:yes gene_type:complete